MFPVPFFLALNDRRDSGNGYKIAQTMSKEVFLLRGT
jgi:hypothetical protein